MLKRREAKTDPYRMCFSDGVACFACCHWHKGKTSIIDKLHDYSDHVLIWHKPQQLASNIMIPDSVICRCQIDKYGTSQLLSFERILDVQC